MLGQGMAGRMNKWIMDEWMDKWEMNDGSMNRWMGERVDGWMRRDFRSRMSVDDFV